MLRYPCSLRYKKNHIHHDPCLNELDAFEKYDALKITPMKLPTEELFTGKTVPRTDTPREELSLLKGKLITFW